MYKGKKILAMIPARAGSKGIKDKNIIDLRGKPLIAYSIEAGKNSKYIDRIIVSTDGENIANVAKRYGADVPFMRPKYLSGDTAKSIDAVLHCIDQLEEEYDYIVLLQPTQPLRTSDHIDEAIELIVEKDNESLVSVCEVEEHPILMRKINEEGETINLINKNSTVRRQDFDKIYKVNGAIYINKINENLDKETSLNDNNIAYIMGRKYSIDIDEELDLKIASLLLHNI